MKLQPKVFFALCLIVAGLLCFLIGRCSKEVSTQDREVSILAPDTVYIEKIKLVEVTKQVLPDKVVIQQQVDSILRKQKEKQTIVLGQKLSRQKNSKFLSIQTIDSAGQIRMNEYSLLDGDFYQMDSQGQIQIDEKNRAKLQRKARRRKVWQGVKTAGLIGIGIIIGNKL